MRLVPQQGLQREAVGPRFTEEVVFFNDPRGREYLWIGGKDASHTEVPGSDTEAYDEGVASLAPLVLIATISSSG